MGYSFQGSRSPNDKVAFIAVGSLGRPGERALTLKIVVRGYPASIIGPPKHRAEIIRSVAIGNEQ